MNKRAWVLFAILCFVAVPAIWLFYHPTKLPLPSQHPLLIHPKRNSAPPAMLTPAEALARFREHDRLEVDQRFLQAFAITSTFPGAPASVQVSFSVVGNDWLVRSGIKNLGQLTQFPDFDAAMALLRKQAEINIAHIHIVQYRAPQQLIAAAESFDDAQLFQALVQLNDSYHDVGISSSSLQLASAALSRLAYLEQDSIGNKDSLYAKAMSLVALAESVSHKRMSKEESLLAYAMGYSESAVKDAQALSSNDPWRLYLVHGDTQLEHLARLNPNLTEPGYLWLRRLAEMNHRSEWSAWLRSRYAQGPLNVSVASTAFLLEGHKPIGVGANAVVITALAATAGGSSESGRIDFSRQPTQVIYDLDHNLGNFRGKIIGPYITVDDFSGYYRGFVCTAFKNWAVYLLDLRGRPENAKAFATLLAGSKDPAMEELHTWDQDKIESELGGAGLRRIISDMQADRLLDVGIYADPIEYLLKRSPTGGFSSRDAARRLAVVFDTRPGWRNDYASVLWYALDIPMQQNIYASLAAQESDSEPFIKLYIYSYNNDAKDLLRAAENNKLNLNSRVSALMDMPDPTENAAAIESRYEQLMQQYPTRSVVYKNYLDFLKKQHDYAEIVRVARLWLASQPAAASTFDIWDASVALADAQLQQGRLVQAWGSLSPALFLPQQSADAPTADQRPPLTGFGSAMDEGVKIALAHKDFKMAEYLAHAVSTEYSDSFSSQMALLRVWWTEGQDDTAARLLANWHDPVADWEWQQDVGETFVDVFRKDPEAAVQAFKSLIAAHVGTMYLHDIQFATEHAKQPALGFLLVQMIPASGSNSPGNLLTAYRYLKQVKGTHAAETWLASHMPKMPLDLASIYFYGLQQYELLWDMIPDTRNLQHPDQVWLLRAAASVTGEPLTKSERRELAAYYQKPDSDWYDMLGRYILTGAGADSILHKKMSPHALSEAAYYLALRALKSGHYSEAAAWLNVDLDTDQSRNGEYTWSGWLLGAWNGEGQSLKVLASKHELFDFHL